MDTELTVGSQFPFVIVPSRGHGVASGDIWGCSSDGKESACNAGEMGVIPGLGRSPGEGNGNALQYSCLESPMDRGA